MKWLARSIGRLAGWNRRDGASALADFLDAPEAPFEPDVWDDGGASAAQEGLPARHASSRTLIVQGWQFLPHSYAIVNQWQLLALRRRNDITLKVQHAPLYRAHWQPQAGLFEPRDEEALRAIPTAAPGESADIAMRISYPYDFSLSPSGRTAVFATLEQQAIREKHCADRDLHARFLQGQGPLADVVAVTPSRWSAEGFYKAGFRTDQVLVVPHGVDCVLFRPMPELRAHVRGKMGIAEDDFVFLSIGTMTSNKGMDLLLQAFAEVSRKFPQARLVLKGVNSLYQSRKRLHQIMQKVPARDLHRVIGRLKYFGKSFSNRQMALFFQSADAYVSPYRAEGFNMPVLEAAACGLPIICTGGGSTDDFVTEAFAQKIMSRKWSRRMEEQDLVQLEPDVDHLIGLMTRAIEDKAWRQQAAKAGPSHVRANYTWDQIVDRLVQGLWH